MNDKEAGDIQMKQYKKWSHTKQKFKTYKCLTTWYNEDGIKWKTVKQTKYTSVEKYYDDKGRLHRDGDFAYIINTQGKKTRGYMYHHGSRSECVEY